MNEKESLDIVLSRQAYKARFDQEGSGFFQIFSIVTLFNPRYGNEKIKIKKGGNKNM